MSANGMKTCQVVKLTDASGSAERASGGKSARHPFSPRYEELLTELLRTTGVLIIIDILLNGVIEPLGPCWVPPREVFHALPLPSHRAIWESSSPLDWQREYENHTDQRKSDKLLVVQDLISLGDSTDGLEVGTEVSHVNLEPGILQDVLTWCGNMDDFGSLIWMVLPFERHRRRVKVQEVRIEN